MHSPSFVDRPRFLPPILRGKNTARDKINLENWVSARVTQIIVVPDEAGAGSADSSSGKSHSGGLLACKYRRSGVAFVRAVPPEFGFRSLPAPARAADDASTAAWPAPRARCSPAATPVRPLTPKLPLQESSWPAASGAVRSRRQHRGARAVDGGQRRINGPKRRNAAWNDRCGTRNGSPPPRHRA